MKRTTGKELLDKLKEGTITTDERKLLEAWYDHHLESAAPFDDVTVFVKDMQKLEKAFPSIPKSAPSPLSFYKLPSFRIGAVAAIIIIFFGIYLIRQQHIPLLPIVHSSQDEVLPGSHGATLTLGNGQKLSLNTFNSGDTTLAAGIHIQKSQDGQLTYIITEAQQGRNETHTLSTDKGETYALILPDKSKVWLNAASSISYNTSPVQQGQRKVVLNGEAYFEVAKDSKHPFIVTTDGQEVEVLGTSFNINAYQEETTVETTLLEGAIKLSAAYGNTAHTKVLTPNQQASVRHGQIEIQKVVASDAIAWKDGFFLFDSENLESVLQKIARWYNVHIVYDNPSLKNETMLGTMSRHEQLSKVLDIIERTGIARFEVKQRVVHVKNK